MNNPFSHIDNRLSIIEAILLELKDSVQSKEPKRYTVKEFSELTDSSEQTVRLWIKKGIVKGDKIGRKIYISESQFQEGLKEVKSLKFKR